MLLVSVVNTFNCKRNTCSIATPEMVATILHTRYAKNFYDVIYCFQHPIIPKIHTTPIAHTSARTLCSNKPLYFHDQPSIPIPSSATKYIYIYSPSRRPWQKEDPRRRIRMHNPNRRSRLRHQRPHHARIPPPPSTHYHVRT